MLLVGFATYVALHFALVSYENTKAHTTFNSEFVKYIEKLVSQDDPFQLGFQLKLDDILNKIKGPGVTNLGFFEWTTGESELNLTPAEWISHGGMSADEPEVPAAVRHFYDPLGLKDGKKYLTNRGTYWEGFYPNPGIDAIEWALGDTPKGESNKWSAKKGKEYMLQAIQETDPQKKRQLLAKAWRCFGEVLHNLADMACPPHVRNDSHAAPLGLSWGWALGSPDPYEEMFNPAWIAKYAESEPDPGLWESIKNAETIREVHEKMAAFTNSNFFSGETISGKGYADIKPLNGEKEYPSPKLENLEYIEEEFTYYKNFPSGRRVKMAKDKGYFNALFRNRGYPYIDKECVESQASELIPNFMRAALKDFALFMPPLQVIIDNIDYENGKIIGTVKTFETEDYPNIVSYNGEVVVFVDSKIYKVNCTDGNFEVISSKSELEKAKKIYAYVDFYGINFYSGSRQSSDYSHLKQFSFNFNAYLMESSTGEKNSFSANFSSKTNNNITWNGNKFSYSLKTTPYSGTTVDKTLYVEMNPFEKNYVKKINYDETTIEEASENGYDLNDTLEFHLEINDNNEILWYSDILQWIHISTASDFQKVLKSITYRVVRRYPIYDDKYKVVGVKRETEYYNQIDYSQDVQLVLFLTK